MDIGKEFIHARKEFGKEFPNSYELRYYKPTNSNTYTQIRNTRGRIPSVRTRRKNQMLKQLNNANKSYRKINTTIKNIALRLAQLSLVIFVIPKMIKSNKEKLEDILPTNYEPSTGKTSNKMANKLKLTEDFRNKAYKLDGEIYWTIGYGHSGPDVKQGMIITKEQAEELFKNDLAQFEQVVSSNVKVPITQSMFDALVSFVYNVGPTNFINSTLLKKLNNGDYLGAKNEFIRWNKDSTKRPSEGLTKRRNEEANLFGKDVTENNTIRNANKLTKSITKGVNGHKFDKNVEISTVMHDYLKSVNSNDRITSGMEEISQHATGKGRTKDNPTKASHYYGLKIDVVPGLGDQFTNEQWANTAIPYLRSDKTEFVDFEDFTKDEFKQIKNLIFKLAPDVKSKCNSNFLKNSAANVNTTGKHLDIKIKEVSNFSAYNLINKTDKIALTTPIYTPTKTIVVLPEYQDNDVIAVNIPERTAYATRTDAPNLNSALYNTNNKKDFSLC